MWPIHFSRCSQNSNSKAFCSLPMVIGVLKKEKKEKEKDNQYKLKMPMAIAIGLMSLLMHLNLTAFIVNGIFQCIAVPEYSIRGKLVEQSQSVKSSFPYRCNCKMAAMCSFIATLNLMLLYQFCTLQKYFQT